MASKKDKLLENAQRFLLKGQLDKAIREYQQVVALEPREVRYRQKLAELLVRDNRKEEAIAQYEDIGKHYADNSYYLKAIAVYKQIQRLSPDNVAISLTLASLNHKQGLTGNAMAEYGQVVARLEREGNVKEAVKALEQMLAVEPAHAATRLKYAELLFATGAREPSYQAFTSLLATLRAGGDPSAANEVSARIKELFPQQQEEDLDQVAARIAAGDLDAAIASLQERVKRESGNLRAWQLLADAQRRQGGGAALRATYGQMLDHFPGELAVVEHAIRCELDAGAFPQALALLEQQLPTLLEARATAVAEELLLALRTKLPGDPRVAHGLRRLYEATGDLDKLNGLAGSAPQSPESATAHPAASAPSAFAPERPEPVASVASVASVAAPAAAGAIDAGGPSFPWEEEIELDLDDDVPDLALAADPGLPLHLSLDLSAPDPFAEAAGGVEGADPCTDPTRKAAPAAPVAVPAPSPFGGLTAADAVSPLGAPSLSEFPSAFGEASDADLPSAFGDLPAGDEIALEPAPVAEEPEYDLSFLQDSLGKEEAVAVGQSLDLDLDASPLELALPAEGFSFSAAEDSEEDAGLDIPGLAMGLDDPEAFEFSEEFDLAEAIELPEADDFPEIGEFPEVPEAAEVLESTESFESLESLESLDSLEEPPQKGWEEIYPNLADAAALDHEELESHYDLGIGYKEMGMYNAAIKELELAAGSPQRRLACLTLQAACYREKGEPAQAEGLLKRGRELDVLTDEERLMLCYELAILSETTGTVDQAIDIYRDIMAVSPNFNDVATRLADLTGDDPLDVIELELEEG